MAGRTGSRAGVGGGEVLVADTQTRASWPDWAVEAWEERSAIMQWDGGMSRADAERKAEAAIILEMAQRAAGAHVAGKPG
jgi:hypothetical protein